jgi:hypothetical protein
MKNMQNKLVENHSIKATNVSQVTPYCEVGCISEGEKHPHITIEGDGAYEHFTIAKFLKEIADYEILKEKPNLTIDEIHRKEKIFFIYEIAKYFDFKLDYSELGSTVFEVIAGLELMLQLDGKPIETLKDVTFRGIEISDFIRIISGMLYKHYDTQLYTDTDDFHKKIDSTKLIYDRAVSSYAFQTAEELANFYNKAEVTFANILMSKGNTYTKVNDVARLVTYFGKDELVSKLNKNIYYLFGRESEKFIEGFFLISDEQTFNDLKIQFESSEYLSSFLATKDMQYIKMT